MSSSQGRLLIEGSVISAPSCWWVRYRGALLLVGSLQGRLLSGGLASEGQLLIRGIVRYRWEHPVELVCHKGCTLV